MGITNLVNATQGDSSRGRLARTGRQRTFTLDKDEALIIKNVEVNSKISTKEEEEPLPSTSSIENDNLYTNRQSRSSLLRTLNSSRLNRLENINNENSLKSFNKSTSIEYNNQPNSFNQLNDELTANQFSSNIRNKLKSRFKRITSTVDENKFKKDNEQNEFNLIKDKVNNRLDETYLWRDKLLSIVIGRDNLKDDKLINYETEFNFFTKQSKTLKQPNKLENLLNNQLKSYLESNHNLYYPSLKKANILIEYPNLNEELKQFFKDNQLPLVNKFIQRILIENNENLNQKHLKLISNQDNKFQLSSNIEKMNLDNLIDDNEIRLKRISINKSITLEESNSKIIDFLNLNTINLRFLKHKHSLKEMELSSEIISNLEFIDELIQNEFINKLTTKIMKLKEVIDLIDTCVQEYEMKINLKQSTNERTKFVQKTSLNLIRNYLYFLNFLFNERDKLVNDLRINLFNLLKNWKEVNNLRQLNSFTDLNLHFEEQIDDDNQNNDQLELNSIIDERLEFEKKFQQFKKTNQFKFRTVLNRFVNRQQSESNENLIQNQEDDETIYLNIKNKSILFDGRLPGEPKFNNFQLTYDNQLNENNENKIDQIKLIKLKDRKYFLQIYNQNKLIYQTNDYALDSNLQISFNNIEFKELPLFDNQICIHIIELKKDNKQKLLTKLDFNIQQILVQTLLHNSTNFIIKNQFNSKSLNGELVLNLIANKQEDKEINSTITEIKQINNQSNLIQIKYEFNDQKLSKFEFKDIKDELDRLYFIYKMRNEIYNQQELNRLLEIIKKETFQNQLSTNDNRINELNLNLNLFKNSNKIELNQRLLLLKQRNDEEYEFNKQRIPLYDSHYLSFLIKDKQQLNKSKSSYLPIELNQTNLNVDLLKAYDNKRKTIIDYLLDVRKKFINQSNTWNKNSKNFEDYVYEEIDTSLSTLNFDFLLFNKESKRPLRPERKERKKYGQSLIQQNLTNNSNSQLTNNQNEKVKIMLNIMSGINIPVRKQQQLNKQSTTVTNKDIGEISNSSQQLNQNYTNFTKRINELFDEEMIHSYNSIDSVISKNIAIDLSLKEQKVLPFIEVTFQDQTIQTSVAESSQPSWSETIKLDLNITNDDYTPSNLLKIDDFIYLNLFDHVEIVDRDDELDKNLNNNESIQKKYTKNWLGSISIPFITLYLNTKIEGTFCVHKPIYLTDYDFESKPTFSLLTTGHNQELDSSFLNNLDTRKNSYLTLFLTIDPQLNLPNKIELKCNTDEETIIYNYAKDWQAQLKKKYPNRLIKSLVINLINGKHTLVCRYLSPLEPPANFLNTEQYSETIKDYKNVLMKNLARYVSLIPMITNELSAIGLIEDIWPDCEQFLKMNLGCVEEHAILLCNYFLYLGLNCGLVLGQGVPEGKTCYVIVWLNELNKKGDNFLNVQLWNPSTGQCYFVHTDNFLPLSSADCIITKTNVYANIQKEDHPNQITFNIMKLNCWRPLFNIGKLKVNLTTIQPTKFEYEQINELYVSNLEQQIEIYLKESLMRWRKKKKTFFNRFCTKEIKKELIQMEYKICNLKEIDPNEEINKLLSTYKINGININLPFNGIHNLAKQIYSTGIHLNTNDKIDYVIAVHLHPYQQNVYSVWIYLAQIQTRIV